MIDSTNQPIQAEHVAADGISAAQGGGSLLQRLNSFEDDEMAELINLRHGTPVLLCYLGFILLFAVGQRLLAPAVALIESVKRRRSDIRQPSN